MRKRFLNIKWEKFLSEQRKIKKAKEQTKKEK